MIEKLEYPHPSRSGCKRLSAVMPGSLCDVSFLCYLAVVVVVVMGGRGSGGGGGGPGLQWGWDLFCSLFTFYTGRRSAVNVNVGEVCDPPGKTLITPNCFNPISRQSKQQKQILRRSSEETFIVKSHRLP